MPIRDEDDHELRRLWRELQRPAREVEWANALLEGPPESVTRLDDKRDVIQEYLQSRVNEARRSVQELEHELYVRKRLHDQGVEQLDYQISRSALTLEQFRGWAVGYNRGVDDKRIELERTLRDLRKEKRSSRVRFWDDAVSLRRELRERRREYEAALRRARLQAG